ncbi:MAG: hypothetical protein H7A51_14610 [Akkermansiaceae bacterium]|nr:hypothetical protein [Akkermansiaceae bacterium]
MQARYQIHPLVSPGNGSRRGFALIATISVMVLLVMVALAMLSLSALELRSASRGQAMADARANARMSLMLAIGELQKYTGDDRRVTVPATQWDQQPNTEVVDGVKHPHLIAAYSSRSLEDELQNILPSNYYDRGTHFLTWLASQQTQQQLESENFARSGSFTDEVVLGAPATASTPAVTAGRIGVKDGNRISGKYAWAVASDESLRGRLPQWPVSKRRTDLASVMTQSGLPGNDGHRIIGDLKNLDADAAETQAYISSGQLPLVVAVDSEGQLAHQLTPYSLSLLTDTKRGGFRNCLNMLLGRQELPARFRRMESFTPRWGGPRMLNGMKMSDRALTGMVGDYDTLPLALLGSYYASAKAGSASRVVTPNSNDASSVVIKSRRPQQQIIELTRDIQADRYWRGYGHSLRIAPVVPRTRDIVWAMSKKVGDTEYELVFLSFPVVTVWNPYNVDVQFDNAWMNNRGHVAEAMVLTGATTRIVSLGGVVNPKIGQWAGEPQVLLGPGETRVFFPNFMTGSTGDAKMHSKWPANFNLLTRYTSNSSTGIKGSATTRVQIGVRPSSRDQSGGYGVSHYSDGWFGGNTGVWQGTKFHNWNFNLIKYVSDGVLPGNDNALSMTLGDLLNRPVPVAIVNFSLKAMDQKQTGMPFLFDAPHRMNLTPHYPSANKDIKAGREASPMEVDVIPLRGDTDLARHMNTMEDDGVVRDFLGYSYTPTRGSTHLTMCELPLVPLHSLGQLQHLPLQDEQWGHDQIVPNSPTWAFGIGNSWAHPWLKAAPLLEERRVALMAKAGNTPEEKTIPVIDRLWVANSLLFDSYYFTTMAAQDNSWYQAAGTSRSLATVMADFLAGDQSLPHQRLIPLHGGKTDAELADELLDGDEPSEDAYRLIASHLALVGGFNINSTSVTAWKMLLAANFKKQMPEHPQDLAKPVKVGKTSDLHVISRFTVPTGNSIDRSGDPYTDGFSGYREVTSGQIEQLAGSVVRQVKERGPFRSLSEFVNRRRTNAADGMNLAGVLQAALEDPEVTINSIYDNENFSPSDFPSVTFPNPDAVSGSRARGMPGFVSQADVLTPIAPVITARGDTFVLRAYGESLDASGKVAARAWCEAVVQRSPEFIDPADEPATAIGDLTSGVNEKFGRRYKIVSFRWVDKS